MYTWETFSSLADVPFRDVILCHGIGDTASCCGCAEIWVPAIARCRTCVWHIRTRRQVIRAAPNLLFIINQSIIIKQGINIAGTCTCTHTRTIKSTSIALYKYTCYMCMCSSKTWKLVQPKPDQLDGLLWPWISTIDTWENSAEMSKLESQETNVRNIFILRCWILIRNLEPFRPPTDVRYEHIPSYIGQWTQACIWYPSLFPRHFMPPVP